MNKVTELFGSMVFNEEVMRQRLSSACYQGWKTCIAEGRSLTIEIANEIADMEKAGIICGYHTLINWEKAGDDHVNALIEVRVTPQREKGFEKTAERICNYPEVNAVYLISGGYDLLVTLEGKTLREVAQFVSDKLSPLESVLSTKTNFILKKYKDHGTVIAKPREDERMLVS